MSKLQQKKVKNFCVMVIVLLLGVKGDESESKGKMLFSTGL